ncbi:MAG: UbiA family prenyltransferase [Bacteroidetes bacterium]|nr:UbiA family prenyltransferase [Bacteroidota bacterium]
MKVLKKITDFILYSNLYIALVALAFTFEAQILLNQEIGWHPYLFIIFFATFFDYNLHRLYTLLKYPKALQLDKHKWVSQNKQMFYGLMLVSTIGFLVSIYLAKKAVLMALLPLALLTIFYSLPFYADVRLRDIPYAKLFLIAFNWTMITLVLPIVQSGQSIELFHFMALSTERFLFMCAICLPFDIRDIESDKLSGLLTIPIKIGEQAAWQLSSALMITSLLMSLIYHGLKGEMTTALALGTSGVINLVLLNSGKLRRMANFHHGVVDGMMLIQAMMVILFWTFKLLS